MPEPIEVRKVPILNVSDASGLADLIDAGVLEADRVVAVIGKTEGNGGVNDYTRIIADRAFREVLVDKGTRSPEEVKQVPIVWSGGTDGVLSPHATIFATMPPEQAEQTDEPRLTVGLRDERGADARGHRPGRDGQQGRRRGQGRDGARRDHRRRRRALRADQDPAADDPHHPRRQEPRQDGVDRAHPRVDGPLQRLHGARHRRRARRDRDARPTRTSCTTGRCSPRSRPAPAAWSSTRRRSSWSATPAASEAATGSATR